MKNGSSSEGSMDIKERVNSCPTEMAWGAATELWVGCWESWVQLKVGLAG
jgi:hypothetical protein